MWGWAAMSEIRPVCAQSTAQLKVTGCDRAVSDRSRRFSGVSSVMAARDRFGREAVEVRVRPPQTVRPGVASENLPMGSCTFRIRGIRVATAYNRAMEWAEPHGAECG